MAAWQVRQSPPRPPVPPPQAHGHRDNWWEELLHVNDPSALVATVKTLCFGGITQQKSGAAKTISVRESQPSRQNCLSWLPVVHPGEVVCQNNSASLICGMGGSHFLSTDQSTEAPRGIIETRGFQQMICVILQPQKLWQQELCT